MNSPPTLGLVTPGMQFMTLCETVASHRLYSKPEEEAGGAPPAALAIDRTDAPRAYGRCDERPEHLHRASLSFTWSRRYACFMRPLYRKIHIVTSSSFDKPICCCDATNGVLAHFAPTPSRALLRRERLSSSFDVGLLRWCLLRFELFDHFDARAYDTDCEGCDGSSHQRGERV